MPACGAKLSSVWGKDNTVVGRRRGSERVLGIRFGFHGTLVCLTRSQLIVGRGGGGGD